MRNISLIFAATLLTSPAFAQQPPPAPAAPPAQPAPAPQAQPAPAPQAQPAPAPQAQPAPTPAQPKQPAAQPAAPPEAAPAPAVQAETPGTETMAAAPAPVAAPAPEPVPPEPAPGPAEEAAQGEKPTPPHELSVSDEGTFSPGLLLQPWIFFRQDTGTPDRTTTTIRIRRAEISAKGTLIPDLVKYKVMFDPARLLEPEDQTIDVEPATGTTSPGTVTVKQPSGSIGILRDAEVTFLTDYANVSVGQFKIPVSLEGSGSSSHLILPERALVSRRFGDIRDLGIKAEKHFDYFGYVAGVFNGQGENRLDSNNQKDLTLRLELTPLEWLLIGGVVYASVGEQSETTTKQRFEGDLRLTPGDALVQGEFITGTDDPEGADVTTTGFYGALGYTFDEQIMPVVRIGYLDPDTSTGDNGTMHYEAGVNYFIRGRDLMLALAYGFFDAPQSPHHDVILATQLHF